MDRILSLAIPQAILIAKCDSGGSAAVRPVSCTWKPNTACKYVGAKKNTRFS